MENKTAEYQAKLYVYDLNNCAREFGFHTDEGWQLSLATVDEKAALHKRYYPVVSAKAVPEMLAELFNLVKSQLEQAKANIQNKLNVESLSTPDLQYLVAFNPKRFRQ
jgi:hypothetical protein